jgi:HEAT repeat protein
MQFVISFLVALLVLSSAAFAETSKPAHSSSENPPTEEEELSLAALEGLVNQSDDRALPILKRVLAGSQTRLVKQRALFVLGQLDSPEARDILIQMSRSPDAGLRGEAIRSIGIGGDKKALAALQTIYDTGTGQVKEEVLQAWLIAGDEDAVYRAALNAKTEAEAAKAIHMLGAMGATDALRKLGDRPNAPRGLVDAYAISGDLASLRKIAEGSADHATRVEAVQKMGIIGTDAARAALRDFYSHTEDKEIKDAAMQGMMIADDDEGLLALYRAAKTTDEKRALMRMLSRLDSDAALKAIDAALEKK